MAEGAPHIDVKPAGLRHHRRKFGHRHGAQQRIQPADNPKQHDQFRVAEGGGQGSRQPQNPDADRAAEDHRQTETKPQNPRQRARGLDHRSMADGRVTAYSLRESRAHRKRD